MPLFGITVDPSKSIPTQQSSYADWITWHQDLASRYGLKAANQLFLLAWAKRQPTSSSFSDITGKHNLVTYLGQNGIKLGENGADLAVDFVYGIADTIGGVFNFGKTLTYIVVGILVIFFAILLFQLAKNPNQTVGIATAAATRV